MLASPLAALVVGILLVALTYGILHVVGVILVVLGVLGLLVGYPAGWYGRRGPPAI